MANAQSEYCSRYYSIVPFLDKFYGFVMVPFKPNTVLELELTGKEKFAAELVLNVGENGTGHNEFLRYYVHFQNALIEFPGMKPQASRITVNGEVLCEGEEYPESRYKLRLWNSVSTERLHFQILRKFYNIQPTFRTAIMTTASTEQSVKLSCGRGTSSITPLIYHGTDLSPGEMPWLIAVYQKTRNFGTEFLCGGTLVSARTAITAAHCFRIWSLTKNNVVLHIGRHNLKDFGLPFTARELENVIIHPDYNASRMADADIAIMHFTEPVVFNELISPICLWSGPNDVAQIVGQKGYIAGWGAAENGISVTNIPKKVDADIVDDMTCVRHNEGYIRLVSGRTLCAGNLDGSGPCSGDSGGGLMIQRDGRWFLRGIVSAGKTDNGMCALNTYVLYCDLAEHMTWVQENVIY